MRLAILLLAALPAAATTVTLERAGVAIGGDVCRFRAGDGEGPFARWLHAQEVTCVASGTSLALAEGRWNVFGRIEGREVTDPLLIDSATAPASITLSLTPAASVTATVAEGNTAVLYAPRRAIAYPLTARTTVPAGEELWLLRIARARPVAIYVLPALEAATDREIDARGEGMRAVLTWLQLPDADRAAIARTKTVAAPQLRAIGTGESTHDADPLPPLLLAHDAFVLLRDVAAGDAQMTVAGKGWLPYRRAVRVEAKGITVAGTPPLLGRGAATVVAHWGTANDLRELERSLGSCEDSPGQAPQFHLTLLDCSKGCVPLRREALDLERPEIVRFEDVVPGSYRAELKFGRLPPVSKDIEVAPFEQGIAGIFVRYSEMYGSLTYGGEPLGKDATLELAGGIGFASRESGEYRAVVLEPFSADEKIEVATCDGALRVVVLAARSAQRSSRLNIDLPANVLAVNVTDTFTTMALAGARVDVVAMSRISWRPVLRRTTKTEDSGAAELKVVPERELYLTVSLPGYEKQSVKPFTMPSSGRKIVDVQLMPARGNRGRILSPLPFDTATISWFSPRGIPTESVEIAADGEFIFSSPHDAGETMVVVSLSHPLWVRRSPSTSRSGARMDQPLELPFPSLPGRDFDVILRGATSGQAAHVGLAIGGIQVPFAAMSEHLALRDVLPLQFRHVLETGPIDILLDARTPRSAHQRLIAGANVVVFE